MKITLKIILISIASSVISLLAVAQPPSPMVLWTQSYGNPISLDLCESSQPTVDGCFVIGGSTQPELYGDNDMLLMKIDTFGNIIWRKTYGGTGSDYGESVAITSDGGFALAGWTYSYGVGNADMYLVKTDSLGNQQWQQTFGGFSFDYCKSIQQTTDGGYILGGMTMSFSSGNEDMYLVKTDAQGNLQWQHHYGGSYDERCYAVRQTLDGGYILAGYQGGPITDIQACLIKTDYRGNVMWIRMYGGAEGDEFDDVRQASDSGYYAVGTTASFGAGLRDYYLVKTNQNGELQWQHSYGGEYDDLCYSLYQTPDKGYLLGGSQGGFYWAVKVDSLGIQLWDLCLSFFPHRDCYSICQLLNGTVIMAGSIIYEQIDIFIAHLSGLQEAWVSLQPVNPPVTIPATGGSFLFTIGLTNCGTVPCSPSAWVMVRLPSGQSYGPVLGPVNVTLNTGASVSRLRTQNVPASAPPGIYTYKAFVGTYPTAKWDSSSFTFTKSSTARDGGATVNDWSCTGEPFTDEESSTADLHPSSFILHPCSPNPFNSTTVLSFELRVPSQVSLKVYDTAGRLVTTLADGYRNAGEHEVTFDGSNLASGLYFVRLSAGNLSAVQKVMLLK